MAAGRSIHFRLQGGGGEYAVLCCTSTLRFAPTRQAYFFLLRNVTRCNFKEKHRWGGGGGGEEMATVAADFARSRKGESIEAHNNNVLHLHLYGDEGGSVGARCRTSFVKPNHSCHA